MANHFRQTAERLRQMANCPRPPGALTDDERKTLHEAAQVLCRLEQLKHDLITTASTSDDENDPSDRVAAELMSLLGLHSGS